MTRNVVILGGGFAGIGAARHLACAGGRDRGIRVTLIDRNSFTTMIPALPDVAGTRIAASILTEQFTNLLHGDVNLVVDTVRHVDLSKRLVVADAAEFSYDSLIVATGSVTDFTGVGQHLDKLHPLADLEDAERIAREFPAYLGRTQHPKAIVVGGGYTGLELACNLHFCSEKHGAQCEIYVIEVKGTVLPGLPPDIREYLEQKCDERHLTLLTNCAIKSFDGNSVELTDGTRFENVFACWSTGTRFGLDMAGEHEQIRDGRLVVDRCLRIPRHPEVYAAGDAAAIRDRGGVARKAVNNSIFSGRHAGRNVVRVMRQQAPKEFTAKDLGWVIPFCNVGVGKLFSRVTLRGRLPLALHYMMCGYRNYNISNRLQFMIRGCRALTASRALH